jgi:hypothetical protein
MKITLSVDSKESIEIGHSDLADILSWLEDNTRHAFFFARLAGHPVSEVRSAVAGKTELPIETLEQLARDASIEVVRRVANNERALRLFELPLIQEMIHRDVCVAADIADNLQVVREDVREAVIQTLLHHADPRVAEAAESVEFDLD